ncbi:GNAT family N-acetyltransferase [Clostridium sp. 'deep sea']|uniref:GNAT family N-acetyltransferase n=1 Tax=Clostridium sp. 'deep sea' TaxID=2779445 RepID=UPI0018969801|nr:GNAT family N-acetyltransferase [Clostridium sp. 'deep sea']QOR34212.1 GNAT family N-acetyltransferase [Clostridium sp. 'deep sea']
MEIRFATPKDIDFIKSYDKHMLLTKLPAKVKGKEYLIAMLNDKAVGLLRYNYFWDNTPFINMLYVKKEHRSKGIGKELMGFFEQEMKKESHDIIMTSTLSNENAQHFYRKLGYQDKGCLMLENEALEIIFVKNI